MSFNQSSERTEEISGQFIEFDCPFCTQPVRAPFPSQDRNFIMHKEPTCALYDYLSPVDYVKACADKAGEAGLNPRLRVVNPETEASAEKTGPKS